MKRKLGPAQKEHSQFFKEWESVLPKEMGPRSADITQLDFRKCFLLTSGRGRLKGPREPWG